MAAPNPAQWHPATVYWTGTLVALATALIVLGTAILWGLSW